MAKQAEKEEAERIAKEAEKAAKELDLTARREAFLKDRAAKKKADAEKAAQGKAEAARRLAEAAAEPKKPKVQLAAKRKGEAVLPPPGISVVMSPRTFAAAEKSARMKPWPSWAWDIWPLPPSCHSCPAIATLPTISTTLWDFSRPTMPPHFSRAFRALQARLAGCSKWALLLEPLSTLGRAHGTWGPETSPLRGRRLRVMRLAVRVTCGRLRAWARFPHSCMHGPVALRPVGCVPSRHRRPDPSSSLWPHSR